MRDSNLIIFDYSGTLSLEAVSFGRSVRLMKELEGAGLTGFGVTSPAVFWNDIVEPTWEEGSTTAVGYANILERRIREILAAKSGEAAPVELSRAVARFIDRYFETCGIAPRWESLLQRLYGDSRTGVIIATDHYAEATGFIISALGKLGITAHPILNRINPPADKAFLVANSADIGFHKADRLFWEAVKENLPDAAWRHLLLVDDFGYNEAEGSPYGAAEAARKREATTVAVLEAVFDVTVDVVPFMIDPVQPLLRGGDGEGIGDSPENLISRVEELYSLW